MATPTSGYSFFWPLLILILGLGLSLTYQVGDLESRRVELVQANEQILPKVKRAEYEEGKLHALAWEILRLAKTDASAARLVEEFKIKAVSPTASAPAAPTQDP